MKLDRLGPCPKTSRRIGFALASGLLVVLAGCASDPNKKVESSETNLTSEQQKAREDQAALDRKQAEERAKSQDQSAEKQLEMQRKQEGAQAEQKTDSTTSINAAKKDVVDAHADMAKERRDFEAKVEERLTKADARAKELKAKSTKLDAKKATDFKTYEKQFKLERAEAGTKAQGLKSTTNDNWAASKSELDKRLDAMESSLDKMGKDL